MYYLFEGIPCAVWVLVISCGTCTTFVCCTDTLRISSHSAKSAIVSTRTESLRNSRPYWNCMTWRFIRRKLGPDYHRLKTMAKRSIEQDLRNRNLGARNAKYKNQGGKTGWTKNSWRMLAMGNQRAVLKRRQLQFPWRY